MRLSELPVESRPALLLHCDSAMGEGGREGERERERKKEKVIHTSLLRTQFKIYRDYRNHTLQEAI